MNRKEGRRLPGIVLARKRTGVEISLWMNEMLSANEPHIHFAFVYIPIVKFKISNSCRFIIMSSREIQAIYCNKVI